MRVKLEAVMVQHAPLHKPGWLKIRPPTQKFSRLKGLIKSAGLHTVCQEAHCPNMSECWSLGTATFMVLGDTCTRGCRFCAVKSGNPQSKVDKSEPKRLGECVSKLGLDYVVITSVDRDDLADQGAGHFAECVRQVKKYSPGIIVEVLTPDFMGNEACIRTVAGAKPEVFGHNLETVKRLQGNVRDRRAGYEQSLGVLASAKRFSPRIYTKSSLMLGLGETREEIIRAFTDLREARVDIVTMGQYLQPSARHVQVKEFVHPNRFAELKELAEEMGFLYAAAGPFVRSSYRAGEYFVKRVCGLER